MIDEWDVWCLIQGIWYYMFVSGTKDKCVNWILHESYRDEEHICVNRSHNARTSDDVKVLYDSGKLQNQSLTQLEFQWD